MDTIFSTNRKSNRVFANILSIFVILVLAFPVTGSVFAQEPNPHFTVFPDWEFFDGLDWPDGATVIITVAGKPECETSKESWGYFFNGNFGEGCNIEYGDEVTFTDGTTTRTHNVRTLYVTDVNIADNTVSGKAEVETGTIVYVWPHDGDFDPLHATVDEWGEWQVNLFDEAGYDIQDVSEGRAEIRDEMGNATAEDWHVTHPHFTVFPEWEFFDGLDWPNEAMVHITVAGKSECDTTKQSWGYFFNGNFGEGCNIEYGDEVTFTDGTTTRTHNVRTLYVTDVDVAASTVSGKAEVEAGTIIYVWAHDGDFEPLQFITTGSDEWSVNLSGVYTIRDDSEGRSEIRDEMGNATASDWHVLHPHFTVFPEWEWFDGWDWPNEAKVIITVAGKPECETAKESWGYFFNGNFGEGCDVEIGDTVTFTDGTTTRSHEVQNLSVTVANANSDVVAGKANPGTTVYVWPHEAELEPLRAIAHKVTGSWRVDFKEVPFDLAQRMGGRSEVRDENGNSTAVDWEAKASSTGLWIVAYTYDAPVGSWEEGLHAYQFEFNWTFPEPGGFVGQEGELFVSSDTPLYEGHVLLRGPSTLRRIIAPGGANCEDIDSINPDQPTRFLVGWIPEYEMTYPEARAYFESISARVVWDDSESAELISHELRPFSFESVDAWFKYACTFTMRK